MDSPVSERQTRPEICPSARLEGGKESVVWPAGSATGVSRSSMHAQTNTRNPKRADLRSSSEFIALPKPASYPAAYLHASVLANQDELKTYPWQEPGPVTKIAIDKQPRESENREHEESCTRVLPASGRLCRETDAGRGHPRPHTEPATSAHRRADRTLCSHRTGKCQHGDLQLRARENRDRFQNRPHHPGLQGHERRKITLRPSMSTCRHLSAEIGMEAAILVNLYFD